MGWVPIVLAAVSTVMQVISSEQQAAYAKKAAQTKATDTQESLALQKTQSDQQLAQVLGTQRAIYGASGVDTSSGGSPFAVGQSTAGQSGSNFYNKVFEAQVGENNAIATGQQEAATDQANALQAVFKFGSNANNISSIQNLFGSSSNPSITPLAAAQNPEFGGAPPAGGLT